jgi:hypothetical protein
LPICDQGQRIARGELHLKGSDEAGRVWGIALVGSRDRQDVGALVKKTGHIQHGG